MILDFPGCGTIESCLTTCVHPTAYIVTPGFPSYYQSGDTCFWKIKGEFGQFVKFHFINLDIINGNISCDKSYIEIFDLNLQNRNTSLGRFCKENRPYEVFTSNWQTLYIEFRASSDTFGGRGFIGKYSIDSFIQGPFNKGNNRGSLFILIINMCRHSSF